MNRCIEMGDEIQPPCCFVFFFFLLQFSTRNLIHVWNAPLILKPCKCFVGYKEYVKKAIKK